MLTGKTYQNCMTYLKVLYMQVDINSLGVKATRHDENV